MIDRIRLTAAAKNQLVTLKRKTGIEHYNSICRHALCISLANPSIPPEEDYNFNGGIDIDWRTFSGGSDMLYLNLLLCRASQDNMGANVECLKKICACHLQRGLSYLVGRSDDYLFKSLCL